MTAPSAETVLAYARRSVFAALAACVTGCIAFALMLLVVQLATHARAPLNRPAIVLVFGTLVSFLPCVIAMTVLVVLRATAWWAYVAGGILAAVAVNTFAMWVNLTALVVTVTAGALGGFAAWYALRRMP